MTRRNNRRTARHRQPRIAIFCAGQTERLYFQSFNVPGLTVLPPRDPVPDHAQLIEDAIRYKNSSSRFGELVAKARSWQHANLRLYSRIGPLQF